MVMRRLVVSAAGLSAGLLVDLLAGLDAGVVLDAG
jgi:hypothetical protein